MDFAPDYSLFEALLQDIQEIRCQPPHVHGNQRIHSNSHTVRFCTVCSLYNILGLHDLGQIVFLIHLTDSTGHATIVGKRILQYKTCHAGLAAVHQILMNRLEAFLAIIIVCIDHNKRGLDDLLCGKYCLTGSPRLCPAFRQSSRNVLNILERLVYRYIMSGADGGDPITDDLFKLLLDILTDDKYHMVEASLNRIMD